MVGQLVLDVVVIRQFVGPAHAMDQDHLLEALVDFRVVNQAHEGCQPGAGGEQEQAPAGLQVVQHQGSGCLAADVNRVVNLEVLQARCQRTVRDLDTEELQMLLVVGAGDAVSARQWLAVDIETDHDELTAGKAQTLRARGAERKQGIVPMVDRDDRFGIEVAHAAA